jgi:tetratricopeptide (TPR) repeat protein
VLARITRTLLLGGLCACLAQPVLAQQTSKVTLDTSETIFGVVAAISHCGYGPDAASAEPIRAAVLRDMARAVTASPQAQAAGREMCVFYRDHQQGDASRDLAQYVSLALNLGEPPQFDLKVAEIDLPPDASDVLGFLPYLRKFYQAAGLHQVWERRRADYEQLIARFHQPVSNLLLSTDVYLRIPISGYVGRTFIVYLEPLAAPGQINSRNYGTDYFMVISPADGSLRLDDIRHTYLHFILDPLILKRANALKRLAPLLPLVQRAPMEDSFKEDASLLVTESLIRAVEARMLPGGKAGEAARLKAVSQDMAEGFVLTRYFYDALVKFEPEPVGLRDALPDWLYGLDVERETKRAAEVEFAAKAAPEVVSASKPKAGLLDLAQQRLAAGDLAGAQNLAQQALDQKRDPGRALFLLAQVATLNKDVVKARTYFERTVEVARDPHLLAWAHIYLGRISDLQEDRETALRHYRAALAAGDDRPATRAAAERGLQQPYEPRVPRP